MTAAAATCEVLAELEKQHLTSLPPDWPAPVERFSASEVARELAAPRAAYSPHRLAAFLSPAAAGMLEELAQAAQSLTRRRFGNAMNLYAPLYVSNLCTNRCKYCGFNATHHARRRRLSLDEAEAQAGLIAAEGFRDLLLVSGEDRAHVTQAYLKKLAARCRKLFASLALEIFQLTEGEYRELFEAGIEGVTIYQETYDRALYAELHPGGPKADYAARLASQEAAARAGMRRLGIGALLGLQDWRFEALALGAHASVLLKRWWRGKVSFSFPRLRPATEVALDFPHLVGDAELLQMMLALRLCFPDAGITLSTRERPELRDRLAGLCVTQISAGSKTNPGGYGETGGDESTEQFAVADGRSAAEVAAMLRLSGFDTVWKDWDTGFLGP